MEKNEYIASSEKRKKGKHLTAEDYGAIQALKKEGFGVCAIARNIGCAPGTVINELRRGTPEWKSNKGRVPSHSPKQGEAVYQASRSRCHRKRKADCCKPFIAWVTKQLREHKWSLDACVGYARKHQLFPAGGNGQHRNPLQYGLGRIAPYCYYRIARSTKAQHQRM